MTLIDRGFLKEMAPDAVMKKMVFPVSVRGVGPGKHSSVNYTTIDIYFPGNKRRTTAIHQEVHMIDSLKAKMLIGMNIFGRKTVTIDTSNKQATIGSCNNIVIPLEVTHQIKNQFAQQILSVQNITTLPRTIR